MALLPPLNALRAFEAAARLMSFSKAADELHVTPAAISQRIRQLEEHLGCKLFHRLTRAIELTPAGAQLAPAVGEGFARISAAVADLQSADKVRPLTVSVLPSFAVKWLIPRLPRFRASYPEIDVRIAAEDRRADFVTDGVDVAIRYGIGDPSGLFSERMMTEEIFVVCSPRLLETGPGLRDLSDLRRYPLIHDARTWGGGDWTSWLAHHEVDGVDVERGLVFSQQDMVLQAAIDGQGVALTRTHLVAEDLRAGRLVRPFEAAQPSIFSYHFVCRPEALATPKVAAFRAWFRAETSDEGGEAPPIAPA